VDNEDLTDVLASKVDALVAKRNMGSTSGDVADQRNIPVLTDLVDAPTWVPEAQPSAPLKNAAEQPDLLRSLTNKDVDLLSQEIFTRVSQRIDAELATRLEARLNEHLQSRVNAAVTHVLTDMKLSIANEIGDAISAALADWLRQK
jgi:hypothetical protein